jgi:HD superfamily phosphohydrolase
MDLTELRRWKSIRDAVHGDIEFDRDEIDLINTREFQRLRRIKQLGIAHLVYPSALHSRFEHVLGFCHLSQRIIDTLNTFGPGPQISHEERKLIRYLALLHDIGHLPFGHILEDERPVLKRKHDGAGRLSHFLYDTAIADHLNKIETEFGLISLRDLMVAVLCGTNKAGKGTQRLSARQHLFADIVGNTICADLLDYLKRDTLFTGIQHRYDDRILSSFRISTSHDLYIELTDDRSLQSGLLSEILHMLRLRYTLGERVYYHRTIRRQHCPP